MNECQSRGKLWCISCQANNHASWDRNCPGFKRRCYMMDKQNPENSMLYFPMEQDWSQTLWSSRIPSGKCFPSNSAVNSLHIHGVKLSKKRLQEPRGKKADCLNPNLIPINKEGRQPHNKPIEGVIPNQSDQPRWMADMEEHITRLSTNDTHSAHEAVNINA